MKKLIFLIIIPISILLITSCDTTDDPVTPAAKGNLYVTSIPAGAQIWIDGVNTSQVTPDTVKNLDEAVYTVTLKLTDYNDSTFTVSVQSGQTSVVTNVALISNISITTFNPVRLYESFGTPASQPSGLDLSSGNAWGISSDSSGVVDIYFYSDQSGNTYLIQSADQAGLIRETDFFVGSGNNIFDEVDSPLRNTGTWAISIDDTENNYVFLYDHDGHYSKMKIVLRGGGTGLGDPSWVDIQWHYNNNAQDNRF